MKTMATREYGAKPVGWNGAWETLLWRFVKGRKDVLEDGLMIQ